MRKLVLGKIELVVAGDYRWWRLEVRGGGRFLTNARINLVMCNEYKYKRQEMEKRRELKVDEQLRTRR